MSPDVRGTKVVDHFVATAVVEHHQLVLLARGVRAQAGEREPDDVEAMSVVIELMRDVHQHAHRHRRTGDVILFDAMRMCPDPHPRRILSQ